MEEYEGPSSERKQDAVTKKRSQISRRPRTTSLQFLKFCDRSPASTSQSRQVSSDDIIGGHANLRTIYGFEDSADPNQICPSVVTPTNLEVTSSSHSRIIGNVAGDEGKIKRVKLKFSSLSHTIQTKSISLGVSQGEKSDPVRKSKRLPKKRVLDDRFEEADEDDEIRYLKKLKTSKFAIGSEDFEEESNKKVKRISGNAKFDDTSEDFISSRSTKDSERSRSERGSEDTDYEEVSPIKIKQELALTTRQRALLSSKGSSSASGASEIEFPYGLPPAPPRKQKEKLSETEQQLKKVEAAQRRRMQNEKAARESEAEAIRKILGQDSYRKKREDKMKQRMDELAQEKATNALVLASNTIRWVMGPGGTVVTFSRDMGLPSIFNYKPCEYPAPRENCAGPSCTNAYKYRDSKSKIPLCSLHCYKAVHEKVQTQTMV